MKKNTVLHVYCECRNYLLSDVNGNKALVVWLYEVIVVHKEPAGVHQKAAVMYRGITLTTVTSTGSIPPEGSTYEFIKSI